MDQKKKQNNGFLYENIKHVEYHFDEIPLNEYPRPNLKRESFVCLNGYWDLAICQNNKEINYDKKVLVPFAVESPLSEVNHLLEPDEILVYKRVFNYKKPAKPKHLFLNCDGIDQICEVYINNNFVGKHVGGYTKFKFDISEFAIDGENEIIIKVQDLTDSSYHSRGKQCLNPNHQYIYSSSSGIYKPIWLEEVNENFIESVKFTPLVDENSVRILIKTNVDGIAHLKIGNQIIDVKTNEVAIINLDEVHLWSPSHPYLYIVNIKFDEDEVESYFGFRKIEIKKDRNNKPQIYLNNKKIILNGVLDQGYYYLGNLTPKSYLDYKADILALKELGFNTIRKHIKIECDMFYYLCDSLGMLVVQDFVNGGEKYSFAQTVFPRLFSPILNRPWFESNKRSGRNLQESKDEFKREMVETMDTLWNYPSIVVYTIFNESWGQFDTKDNYLFCKFYDGSRLFDASSGWIDTRYNDFYSVHAYTTPKRIRHDKKKFNRPYYLSETGGRGYEVKGHFDYGKLWGQGYSKDQADMDLKYKDMYEALIKQVNKGDLVGIIYTQLSDIECEANGLFTFDREVLKITKKLVQDVNQKININIEED